MILLNKLIKRMTKGGFSAILALFIYNFLVVIKFMDPESKGKPPATISKIVPIAYNTMTILIISQL